MNSPLRTHTNVHTNTYVHTDTQTRTKENRVRGLRHTVKEKKRKNKAQVEC